MHNIQPINGMYHVGRSHIGPLVWFWGLLALHALHYSPYTKWFKLGSLSHILSVCFFVWGGGTRVGGTFVMWLLAVSFS